MTAPELPIGHIVAGKYAIQSLLHYGGSIATYHAMTAPNREVALKLYDARIKSVPELMKTLTRYEMVVNSLPSHLVVQIEERGEDPATGAPYTVTNFQAHPSLAELVELCPLSPAEMVALTRSLAKVVDLAHANGISHLGLKPTNVFVRPGPSCEVRVVDFGLSHVRSALPDAKVRAAVAPWLAPEQMKESTAPGPAADIFASALVAFFAVTGKSFWRAFQPGRPDVSAWEFEILGTRLPVSERAREVSISLKSSFDVAFGRALAVLPTARFGTATQFADALAAAIEVPSVSVVAAAPVAGPAMPPRGSPLRTTAMGIGAPAGAAAAAAQAQPAPRPGGNAGISPVLKTTMLGMGNPTPPRPVASSGAADVPAPPQQVGAALAAFEKPPVHGSLSGIADETTVVPTGDEPITIQSLLDQRPPPSSRAPWIAGIATAIVVAGSAVFALSSTRGVLFPEPPPAAPAVAPPAEPTPAHLEPAAAPPEMKPQPAEPESAAPVIASAPPPASAPPAKASAAAASASPPPAKVAAPAPAKGVVPAKKKPCGKFLKRCN